MTAAIEFMFLPFLACLLLVGINVYFGIHVIKREIIFIDIAMAQIAAFGGALAHVLGLCHDHDEGGLEAYLISIAFVLFAAGLFTLLKNKKLHVPLEALIGIAYAVAATGTVLLLDAMAGADVHVHDMIAGSILWVTPAEVAKLAAVFLVVGLLHFIFRRQFVDVTATYTQENGAPAVSRWWDFLFYASFGVAVVQSVSVGGILTVFAFLIIPAAISALFADGWAARVLIGWGLGTAVSICGLYLSWTADVPSGPTVILFLGISTFIVIGFRGIKSLLDRSQ